MIINVTKPSLPDFDQYSSLLKGIWERGHLTNRGPLVNELESRLKERLKIDHLLFVANGTIALQIAIKALGLKGEIITTPFSYVATTTAIIWENCEPVFVDIEDQTFCINPELIESKITDKTSAILATHVYGFPCQVEKIEKIASKYNLKVIYDAAHAFGVTYKNTSILKYGDISTLSFHATKLFHTVEGGSISTNDKALQEILFNYHSFGHLGDEYFRIGINGKNSELHAAMGLCNLPQVDDFIAQRKSIAQIYQAELSVCPLTFLSIPQFVEYNYAYFPVVFRNEAELLLVKKTLESNGINTRRYFYPSLNKLPYLESLYPCPVSEDISRRVLCLPFYQQLATEHVMFICGLIKTAFSL